MTCCAVCSLVHRLAPADILTHLTFPCMCTVLLHMVLVYTPHLYVKIAQSQALYENAYTGIVLVTGTQSCV